jgi:acetoin utilization deacetylase AcuC-like enzyme
VNVVYSARYHVDIGPHVFPTQKYRLVHARLLETGVLRPSDAVEPRPAAWDELALVHTAEYLDAMRSGTLSPDQLAQLELPWSEEIVEAFRLMVGGTTEAALIACGLEEFGIGNSESGMKPNSAIRTPHSALRTVCHIGGGLHHAFPNHGEGFCPFNDVAVAVRVLQRRGLTRLAVVDLDVHHGNGTAFIFESEPCVFVFSMHQQQNYPMWKPRGSLDIGLSDGTGDATFLRELDRALPQVMAHSPECVFYLAGADPYEEDQLGGLRLTKNGLRRRDRIVIDAVRGANIPLVVTLAGGYARRVEDTVDIHVATIEEAMRA